ncbi:MAG TPA: hypothetical protein VKD67_09080 [Acidimicrobiales bacterium]|jgi:hypothetical protein|nr:hypothetical protein [Acidimicrobiales bacterium]
MATSWRSVVVPAALVVLLAACGSDNSGAASTTPAPTSARRAPAASGTAPSPASTGDTAAPTQSSIAGADDEIIVHVGVDDAATVGSRVEKVKRGDNVILRLTSDSDEDYHVHGYDLKQKVAAGVEAQFEFKADMAGDFEVESHVTHKVYVVLHVA